MSSRQNSSNRSYESTLSRITEEGDEYKSAFGSIRSFIYSSIFGGETNGSSCWDSAESELEKEYSITEETWLTPTQETATSFMDSFENQSLLMDSETLTLPAGSESMSCSSSTHSMSQFKRHEKMQSTKSKNDLKWYERITNRFLGSSETIPLRANYERLPRYDSRPVPRHLLEYQGPECPFVVRTKDFQLYTKFTLDKVIDEDT